MGRFLGYLVPLMLMLVAAHLQAQTIDTFLFPTYAEPLYYTSGLAVGPDGNIWFTASSAIRPLRVFRAGENGIECVAEVSDFWSSATPVVAPNGMIYFDACNFSYSPQTGVTETHIEHPWDSLDEQWYQLDIPAIFTWDMHIFTMWHGNFWDWDSWGSYSPTLWELFFDSSPVHRLGEAGVRYSPYSGQFIVSAHEYYCFFYPNRSPMDLGPAELVSIDLDTGEMTTYWEGEGGGYIVGKDSNGVLWLLFGPDVLSFHIATFDFHDISLFAEGQNDEHEYGHVCLTADGTVWAIEYFSHWATSSVARWHEGQKDVFTVEDGLISDRNRDLAIDYDGRIWIRNTVLAERSPYYHTIGLSRITDGGWPPMRISLAKLETPEGILVEAQVINNGPVVGVDVYVALELNGQLLYWPNWQPEPCPVQVNLRPGHNQTATIISAPRSNIPPGAYTFYACMTGRGTEKLIGPLDRKFETLTVEVD